MSARVWCGGSRPESSQVSSARLHIEARRSSGDDVVQRAIQLHGSLGMTLELPLADMWMGLPAMALADGPTEVHKIQVAKAYLKNATPAPGLFPSEHIPTRLEAIRARG